MAFYVHRKGGEYRTVCKACYADHPNQELMVYMSEDGNIWVRDYAEFMDGRFTAIKPADGEIDGKTRTELMADTLRLIANCVDLQTKTNETYADEGLLAKFNEIALTHPDVVACFSNTLNLSIVSCKLVHLLMYHVKYITTQLEASEHTNEYLLHHTTTLQELVTRLMNRM